MSPAVAGELFTNSATWESQIKYKPIKINSKKEVRKSRTNEIPNVYVGRT